MPSPEVDVLTRGFRTTLPVLVLVLVLVTPMLPLPAAAQTTSGTDDGDADVLQDGVTYEWWNDGWHMRVPVHLEPRFPDAVVEGRFADTRGIPDLTVSVEVDFTEAIRRSADDPDRSWPQDVSGALNSFTFDEDSVRVVEYDRGSGTIKQQPDRSTLVPSIFTPTLLENPENRNDRFDPHANAVGTVTWTVNGEFNTDRLYFVYFDIEENGDKPEPDTSAENLGDLNGLYWIRRGTDIYGYAPWDPSSSGTGSQPQIDVYGLYDDTAVQIYRYTHSGLEPTALKRCTSSSVGACVDANDEQTLGDVTEAPTFEVQPMGDSSDTLTVRVKADQPFHFYVRADKPVYTALRPTPSSLKDCPHGLFYPSEDGGLVGTQYRFRSLQRPDVGVCKANLDVNVIATQERARVNAGWSNGGESFVLGPGEAKHLRIPAGSPVFMSSTTPIAVAQAGTRDNMGVQVPSAYGSPVGDTFYSPLYYGFRAWASGEEPVEVQAYNTADASVSSTKVVAPAPHDPWLLDMHDFNTWSSSWGNTFGLIGDGDFSVVLDPDQGVVPWGGVQGTTFEVPMRGTADDNHRMVVYPAFDRTHVMVRDTDTGEIVFNETINRHRFLEEDRGGSGYLFPGPGAYRVESSKPVFVYTVSPNFSDGNGRTSTYFSSATRSPVYHVGEGEFHGNLIRWGKSLRTLTLAPGEDRRIGLDVTNLGRSVGKGNLPDDVVLQLNSSREWPVTLSSTFEAGVETFETRRVTLVIEVPEEAETGQTLQVNLTATSQGNPEMTAESELQVAVRTRHSVDTVFRANNLKSIERLVESGESTTYAILVNNTGTGDDAFKFTVSDCSRFGYDTRVEAADGSVLATPDTSEGSVAIPRNEERVVFLNVTSTGDSSLGFGCEAAVQAISVKDNSARSQVVATTVPDLNTEFSIRAQQTSLPILPGENATFQVEVVNEGDDTVVTMGTSPLRLPGWSVTPEPESFLLRANGTRNAQGEPGDVRVVNVTLTAGDDAPVGEIMDLGITATSSTSSGTSAEAGTRVRAVVGNNFTLDLRGVQPRSLLPGDDFTYRFTASNAANGPFDLRMNVTGLPPGWSFDKTTPLATRRLDTGDAVSVAGDLQVPSGAESGAYNVTFSFFMETPDGERGLHQFNATIQVARRANLQVTPPSDLTLVPPGSGTRVPLNVTNVGNVDLSSRLTLDVPDGWSATFLNRSRSTVNLAPGETIEVDVLLEAPASMGSSSVVWTVDADLPLGESKSFDLAANWIKRDLRIEEVRSITRDLTPGEPGRLAVTVVNDGNVPANGVDLAILVDGEVVRNLTLESLPPGETRLFQIPWTVVEVQDNLTVALDHRNEFVETDETNNAKVVELPSEANVPGPGFLLLVLTAAVGAVVTRRWRRW